MQNFGPTLGLNFMVLEIRKKIGPIIRPPLLPHLLVETYHPLRIPLILRQLVIATCIGKSIYHVVQEHFAAQSLHPTLEAGTITRSFLYYITSLQSTVIYLLKTFSNLIHCRIILSLGTTSTNLMTWKTLVGSRRRMVWLYMIVCVLTNI